MQKAYIIPSKVKPSSIKIPGSKSYTNRALIIASLAEGKTILKNPLFSDDTVLTVNALRKLGVKIDKNKDELIVHGKGRVFKDPKETLFLGNAGTGLRFITALLSLCPFKIKITGNERMQERPVQDLIKGLKQLGVKIESIKKNGRPPLKIKGGNLKGGDIEISGKASSQFISAILMVAPYSTKDVIIKITDKLISKPYIDMTLKIINDFGVKVINNNYKQFLIKSGQKYKARKYKIEGDASSASYFYALSAIHNVPIKIENINTKTLQADSAILDIIKKMKKKKNLKPLGKIDLNHMPDAAMTVAILASFAKGKSILTNIESLRVKETDRIYALVKELKKVGVRCRELKDGIEINGNPEKLHGNTLIETYNDHRMAMCFAVLASKIPNLQILDPECTSKTYPGFFNDLKKTGVKINIKNIPNIVLTGMRGCGKTAVGKRIAKKLYIDFIDTDEEIEKQEKMKIFKIIKNYNWFYFRKKEKYIIRKISKIKNIVIATGGGAIIDKENEKYLKKHGKIVFLKYDLGTLEKRLNKSRTIRPKLTKQENLKKELKEIWKKRKKRYIESADIVFEAPDNIGLEEKAEKIIMLV